MLKTRKPAMRSVALCASFLLAIITSGCCWVVARSGDAKVSRCYHLIHLAGSQSYRIELPAVSLGAAHTSVLKVRNLPEHLKGQFAYQVSMRVPVEDSLSDSNAPWKDAKVRVEFRTLEGSTLLNREFVLGDTPHGFSSGQFSWEVGWYLGDSDSFTPFTLSPSGESYDIVVTVKQPSQRSSDKLSLKAYAMYFPQRK